ncbi:galactose 1-dehydrogenase [Sphingomonas sp. Leaf412]|nr:galactose 1-dehydrogenase [Sphingomonas sp. Leaf412]
MTLRIAVVGLGKIAHDQHLPAIAASPDFDLVAAASLEGGVDGVPVFRTIDDLLASDIAVDAVAMCQPPQARYDAALTAIRANKHVLLEKPPGATMAECEGLVRMATATGTTLFAAWHSRYAPGVAPARAWLSSRRILSAAIVWKEDVRRWHPGQRWIWEPGGLGVFDPGINALSIATHILPGHIVLRGGTLDVPSNRAAPIAADLTLVDMDGAPISVVFDWRQTGPQTWDISVETADGRLELERGGAALRIAGEDQSLPAEAEYPRLYAHFADLIRAKASDTDRSPLRLVADAFLRARHVPVAPFDD